MTPITYSQALSRGFALRCPRCGEGRLFRNFFLMHRACDHCGFVYERAPGFFLGSAYINYGFTAVTVTILFAALHYGLGWSNRETTWPLVAYLVTVPLILFRYARSLWLALDCFYDPVGAAVSDPYALPEPEEPDQP